MGFGQQAMLGMGSGMQGSGLLFPQHGVMFNPLMMSMPARPQKRPSAGGSGHKQRQDKRPRSTTGENFPHGCTTYWQIPEDDKLRLAELFEPETLNRIQLFACPEPREALLNAILVEGLRVNLCDQLTSTVRLQNEQTCLGRYKSLGCPLRGCTVADIVKAATNRTNSHQTGVSYSLHKEQDAPHRQYLHNGLSSTWLDGFSNTLHLNGDGKAYLWNGQISKFAEDYFSEEYCKTGLVS